MSNTSEAMFVQKWYRSEPVRLTERIAVYAVACALSWVIYAFTIYLFFVGHDSWQYFAASSLKHEPDPTYGALGAIDMQVNLYLTIAILAISFVVIILRSIFRPGRWYKTPLGPLFIKPLRALGKWVDEYNGPRIPS